MENSRFRPVFLDNYYLLKKPKSTNKTTFKFFHKRYTTAVALATMTFQDGGYFGFKVI
jgi:hypothetical protein